MHRPPQRLDPFTPSQVRNGIVNDRQLLDSAIVVARIERDIRPSALGVPEKKLARNAEKVRRKGPSLRVISSAFT